MGVTSQQCNLLLTSYRTTKGAVDAAAAMFGGLVTAIITSLGFISDALLDDLLGLLPNIEVPDSGLGSLIDELDLEACPAFALIYPPEVIEAIQNGEEISSLPGNFQKDFENMLADKISGVMDKLMDPTVAAAMAAIKVYDDTLQDAGFGELLDNLKLIESCLTQSCGLLQASEHIADSTRSSLKISSTGKPNLPRFAAETGLTPSKLQASYDQYASKMDV